MTFISQLQTRNATLFYFGCICFALALAFFLLSRITNTQVFQVNAWNKPLKFALSLGIYSWTMGWYCSYLSSFNINAFNWTVVALWSFEIVYIALQAGRGQLSHYNVSTPMYGILYGLMGAAATAVTIYTAYIGYLFFSQSFPELPSYYVWAIRLSLLVFVIFSFEGFLMGTRMSHSVGAMNDNSNWFILGWSKTVGDLRVAHFIGMHALQVLPLLSFYLLKNTTWTFVVFGLYLALSILTLVQALQGKPLVSNG